MKRKYKVLKAFICPVKRKQIEAGTTWETQGMVSQFENNKIKLGYIKLLQEAINSQELEDSKGKKAK